MRKVTPERAIAFARLSLAITFSWPLPTTATRKQVVRFKILHFLSLVNIWLLFVPALMVYTDCSRHLDICFKTMPVAIGSIQVFMQNGFCRSQYKNLQCQDLMKVKNAQGTNKILQLLIAEMENHCKRAKGYEKDILQRYVDRYAMFYGITIIWYYFGASVFIVCAPFLESNFPTHAKYPFDVEHQPLKTIIFIQQSYAGIHIASQCCCSVLIAILLWFAGARFDMLSNELRMVSNVYELAQCIRKHQQVIQYANDVTHTVRFMVFGVVCTNSSGILFCGLSFITRQPIIIKMQYVLLSFVCLFEVFTCCWPANNLLLASLNAGQAIYESLWYFRDIHLQKNLRFILLRCQKPVVVTIACIMPIVSLKYYGSFISTAFSYFTALRIIFGADEA